MGHQALFTVKLDSILTKAFDFITPGVALNYAKLLTLGDGTGADQSDMLWFDQRTLNASSSEDLDLRGGFADVYGTTLNFVRIKALLVYAALANANNVNVGGAPSNGITTWVGNVNDIVVVRPGGLFLLVARDATAYTTTAGTADLLRIANGGAGTSVTYDIAVVGCSA